MLRLFTIVPGVLALLWIAVALPLLWDSMAVERVGTDVAYDRPVKFETLTNLLPALSRLEQADRCRPAALHNSALARLRLYEEIAARGERARIDESLEALNRAIRKSLACSPADPLLWLLLYWADNAQRGFRSEHFEFLRMSYRLGANEGWIAAKRNRAALAVFEELPADLQARARTEFLQLVKHGSLQEAADTLIKAAPGTRDRLLAGLEIAPARMREDFSKLLDSRGHSLAVPGVMSRDERPWR